MKKYLVDVYLPASGMHIDAFLPNTKEIGEVTPLLAKAAEIASGGSFMGSPDTVLLNSETGAAYALHVTVEEAGIRNASRLMLI